MNPQPNRFAVVAIPLNRPEIVDFLLPPSPQARGAGIYIVGQRPTRAAETNWMQRVTAVPTLQNLLTIDDPHGHLRLTTTDRLVPVQFLRDDPDFLTRNLGGWAAHYFAVIGWRDAWPDDPLLNHAEILANYDDEIRTFGADPALTATRLPDRKGYTLANFANGVARLATLRQQAASHRTAYIERVYAEIANDTCFGDAGDPVPDTLLLDELLAQLVRLERRRRFAAANGDTVTADRIARWQQQQREARGLIFILKGEYIMGRHRRSTVLIAPELGVVVKQPGPEPFHEVELGQRTVDGKPENWPLLTHDGALVTPRGRLRLVLEEGVVPKLHDAFQHGMYFSTLLGLTIEAFVPGPTVQEWVLADPARLTPDLYDVFVLHQQGCELLGVENGDWHSANFVRQAGRGEFVHVDWGAARPLRPDELTETGREARLNQVQNIAYSFHDDDLADKVLQMHQDLLADEARLARIRRQAAALVAG